MRNERNSGTKNIFKNTGITLVTQIASLLLKFVLQKVFLETLGVSYLGYSSVFNNILQMLNMADLGVGVAVTSYLYKPIAEDDKERINALMYLYKKIYTYIGCAVAVIGVFILFLIPSIIRDADCSNGYLRFLFAINLIGVVSTYFLAYKRTLLVAQQKAYFTNGIDFVVTLIATGLQIIWLFIAPDYVIYLCITVGKNIISNIIISVKCTQYNKFLSEETNKEISAEYKAPIWQYVKDVFIAKIGSYIYYGTDNIIISIFRGSIWAGYLANYSLIITALKTIITQVFVSLQATYGNYIATEKEVHRQKEATDMYFYLDYIVANICFIGCAFVFQPFISLYVGEQYQLEYSTVLLLSINLGLTILLIIPSQVFVVYKLYGYDKPIVAVSALLNIVISIVLVNIMGINGVLIGTTFTSLIYLVSRLYIIAKKVYHESYWKDICKLLLWGVISFLTYSMVDLLVKRIVVESWIGLLGLALICVLVATIIPVILMAYTKDSRALWRFFKSFMKNKRKN